MTRAKPSVGRKRCLDARIEIPGPVDEPYADWRCCNDAIAVFPQKSPVACAQHEGANGPLMRVTVPVASARPRAVRNFRLSCLVIILQICLRCRGGCFCRIFGRSLLESRADRTG